MLVRALVLLASVLLSSAAFAQAVPKQATPPAVTPKATTPTTPAAGTPKAATPTAPAAGTPKAAAAAPPAPTTGPLPPPVVGIVDVAYIRSNAAATKSITNQLRSIQEIYSAEINKLEEQLRQQDQELQRQQAILAPDAFAARRREFDAAVESAQRLVDDRNRNLDRLLSDAMAKVSTAVAQVLQDLSAERGYNIILDRDATLLFFARSLDLTGDVLALLDQRLPNVEVPRPAANR
jgi:Skp family chaperone for outer membrane proteins